MEPLQTLKKKRKEKLTQFELTELEAIKICVGTLHYRRREKLMIFLQPGKKAAS